MRYISRNWLAALHSLNGSGLTGGPKPWRSANSVASLFRRFGLVSPFAGPRRSRETSSTGSSSSGPSHFQQLAVGLAGHALDDARLGFILCTLDKNTPDGFVGRICRFELELVCTPVGLVEEPVRLSRAAIFQYSPFYFPAYRSVPDQGAKAADGICWRASSICATRPAVPGLRSFNHCSHRLRVERLAALVAVAPAVTFHPMNLEDRSKAVGRSPRAVSFHLLFWGSCLARIEMTYRSRPDFAAGMVPCDTLRKPQ